MQIYATNRRYHATIERNPTEHGIYQQPLSGPTLEALPVHPFPDSLSYPGSDVGRFVQQDFEPVQTQQVPHISTSAYQF